MMRQRNVKSVPAKRGVWLALALIAAAPIL